jgi:hypothetical protein
MSVLSEAFPSQGSLKGKFRDNHDARQSFNGFQDVTGHNFDRQINN